MLENSDCTWEAVLDLFAGSGALGIEALSRGAQWADFVDNNRECCSVIKENLERTRYTERAGVHCMSAHRACEVLERRYNVVFLDPPYDAPATGDLLSELSHSSIPAPNALLVVSHGDRHPLADSYGTFTTWKKRRYGDSHISIYRREEL